MSTTREWAAGEKAWLARCEFTHTFEHRPVPVIVLSVYLNHALIEGPDSSVDLVSLYQLKTEFDAAAECVVECQHTADWAREHLEKATAELEAARKRLGEVTDAS